MNQGCITNLPEESCVEVPCYVDGNGISVPQVGDLPLGAATWEMVDEMLIAGEKWLPQYTEAIKEAKAKFARGKGRK